MFEAGFILGVAVGIGGTVLLFSMSILKDFFDDLG